MVAGFIGKLKSINGRVKMEECVGQCTKCGSTDIIYGVIEPEGEGACYPYECNECSHEGKEHFVLKYEGSD